MSQKCIKNIEKCSIRDFYGFCFFCFFRWRTCILSQRKRRMICIQATMITIRLLTQRCRNTYTLDMHFTNLLLHHHFPVPAGPSQRCGLSAGRQDKSWQKTTSKLYCLICCRRCCMEAQAHQHTAIFH